MMNLIVSAPSGSGKTTILKRVFEILPNTFGFSVSATTRQPRNNEIDGTDYYFLTEDEFNKKLINNEFLEYEQVYKGLYYGTLKSEIQRIQSLNLIPVFDVDVKGGVKIKNILLNEAYSIFIMPPDLQTLKQRLINRQTETEESLQKRMNRAEMELSYANKFDAIIINDDLNTAIEELLTIIRLHIL